MVAPYTTTPIKRSLVRIIGSGHGGTSDFQVLDFSRVSSTAAVVAARDTFPWRSSGQRQQVSQHSNDKMASESPADVLGIRPVESDVRLNIARETNLTKRPSEIAASVRSVEQSGLAQDRGRRGTKRPCDKDEEISWPTPAKLPRTLPSQRCTQGQDVTHNSTIFHESSATAQTIPSPPGAVHQGVRLVTVPTVMARRWAQQVVAERNKLRQENQVLSRKVTAMRQLFSDKDKLTIVLRGLGMTVC